ncbi:hypothetical protein SOVF_108040 [Spinacia oleracea]|nr:hypothetical protein SOVF_108040 [Spinacia oleracea]
MILTRHLGIFPPDNCAGRVLMDKRNITQRLLFATTGYLGVSALVLDRV